MVDRHTVGPDAAGHLSRRRVLAAATLASLGGFSTRGQALGGEGWGPGARLTADFEPQAAMWLGHDAGHEDFTADLAAELHPQLPLKMLVRDASAEAEARALLALRNVPADRVQYLRHPQAIFFTRDAAVFGLDALGRLAVVDFRWSHYGWSAWCRRRHAGDVGPRRAVPRRTKGRPTRWTVTWPTASAPRSSGPRWRWKAVVSRSTARGC